MRGSTAEVHVGGPLFSKAPTLLEGPEGLRRKVSTGVGSALILLVTVLLTVLTCTNL